MTREALAEIARGAWTPDQFRALKAVLQLFANAFDGILLMRGRRTKTEGTLGAAFECSVECNFQPKTVLVLSCVDSTGTTFALPPIAWAWTASGTSGKVTFSDPGGLFAGMTSGAMTLDVFMEKS